MDLRPEHGEERGEERQREHDRERDHDGAPHPHGPEKRAPEEHEPTEPCSHREAREAHDASRAFERTRERLRIVVPGRDLFAVAAQGEERIVDGDAEPDERADVDRVLRDVDDVREPEHHGDPADDGQRAHPDGQRGRDDCPEDEQQDEERERQRNDLGADQVVPKHTVEVVHEGHLAGARDREFGRAKAVPYGRIARQRLL